MIRIIQQQLNRDKRNKVYENMGAITLNLDVGEVIKDIGFLERYKPHGKADLKNASRILDYLDKITDLVDENSNISITWNKRYYNIPDSSPIRFIDEPLYKVNTCNYIIVPPKKRIIELDMIDLADLMTAEIMQNDLFINDSGNNNMQAVNKYAEELLKDYSIIGAVDSTEFLKKIRDDNPEGIYQMSRWMRFSSSPYYSYEIGRNSVFGKRVLNSYFYDGAKFDAEYYNEVVDYSCKYANFIVADYVIENNKFAKLIMIGPTRITFMVDDDNMELIDKNEDITVRAFGRNFIVKPKITVY